MKILVLGIGKQGIMLLRDLNKSPDVSEIVAGDINIQRVQQSIDQLASDKVRVEQIDIADHVKFTKLLTSGFDIVVNALPWNYNFAVAKNSIEARVHYVDLGPSPVVFQLDQEAKAADVTVIPSCGLDPGIDSILEGVGARSLEQVERIHMWCGGIPQKNTPAYHNPLRYKITWWWEGVVSTYCGVAEILRNGQRIQVDKLTGPDNPEVLRFPEPVGECEAFYAGAPLLLIQHLDLEGVNEAWSKTVRWPGHCRIWNDLIGLGLTRTDLSLRIKESHITPREFLIALGNKTLMYEPGEADLVVQRVQVMGEKQGEKTTYSYEFMDFYNTDDATTAMARTTAFPCSIVTQMLARGEIKEKGVVHAAKIGWHPSLAKTFFSELKKRNIHINETVSQVSN